MQRVLFEQRGRWGATGRETETGKRHFSGVAVTAGGRRAAGESRAPLEVFIVFLACSYGAPLLFCLLSSAHRPSLPSSLLSSLSRSLASSLTRSLVHSRRPSLSTPLLLPRCSFSSCSASTSLLCSRFFFCTRPHLPPVVGHHGHRPEPGPGPL